MLFSLGANVTAWVIPVVVFPSLSFVSSAPWLAAEITYPIGNVVLSNCTA